MEGCSQHSTISQVYLIDQMPSPKEREIPMNPQLHMYEGGGRIETDPASSVLCGDLDYGQG